MTEEALGASQRGFVVPERLRRRDEFVRASASGMSRHYGAFKLQMAIRADDAEGAPRFGFTVTKKVAGAVGRNRIRRRLKEALRVSQALGARSGRDYVFIARRAALTAPFADLIAQMEDGLAGLGRSHEANRSKKPKNRPVAP
jgi:ribonuclease P protein component